MLSLPFIGKIFLQGPPNTFVLENALKKPIEYFLRCSFLFESTNLTVNDGK